MELVERQAVPAAPDDDRCQCGACSGSPTPLPFERSTNMPVTATNGACLLPAALTNATAGACLLLAATTDATDGALLLPTTTGSTFVHKPSTALTTFPRLAPGQQHLACFLAHPIVYYAPPYYQPLPLLLAHHQQALGPPVIFSNSRPRKRKLQEVEYQHCCKKSWKYHVIDKQEGKMGAPPHCLACPVRKQRRHPNRGPKGPH